MFIHSKKTFIHDRLVQSYNGAYNTIEISIATTMAIERKVSPRIVSSDPVYDAPVFGVHMPSCSIQKFKNAPINSNHL